MTDFPLSSRSSVGGVVVKLSPVIFCNMNSATPSLPSLHACVKKPVVSPRDPLTTVEKESLGPTAQKNSLLPSG